MSGHGWASSTRRARRPAGWDRLRQWVLARDGHLCQLRLDGCTTRATCVHHIERDNHEPTKLQASCEHCNAQENLESRPRPQGRQRPPEAHPGRL